MMPSPCPYLVTVTASGAAHQQHQTRSLSAIAPTRRDIPDTERQLLTQLQHWAFPLWVRTVSQPQRRASP